MKQQNQIVLLLVIIVLLVLLVIGIKLLLKSKLFSKFGGVSGDNHSWDVPYPEFNSYQEGRCSEVATDAAKYGKNLTGIIPDWFGSMGADRKAWWQVLTPGHAITMLVKNLPWLFGSIFAHPKPAEHFQRSATLMMDHCGNKYQQYYETCRLYDANRHVDIHGQTKTCLPWLCNMKGSNAGSNWAEEMPKDWWWRCHQNSEEPVSLGAAGWAGGTCKGLKMGECTKACSEGPPEECRCCGPRKDEGWDPITISPPNSHNPNPS